MSDVRARTGLLQGVLAYSLWGVVAAYWKLVKHVAPVELIAHRAIWGLARVRRDRARRPVSGARS